jgi:hypothetical protein
MDLRRPSFSGIGGKAMSKPCLSSSFEEELSNWLYAGDPLIRPLVVRFGMTPARMILAALLWAGVEMVYAWRTGYLFSTDKIIGFLGHWSNLFFPAVFLPSVWAFYVWMPRGISEVFNKLRQNGAFAFDDERELMAFFFPADADGPSMSRRYDRVLRRIRGGADRYVWISISSILTLGGTLGWIFVWGHTETYWYGICKPHLFLMQAVQSGWAPCLVL